MTPAELENFDFSVWAQSLTVAAIPAVLAQLASVQTVLAARLIAAISDIGGGNAGPNREDRLVGVNEASSITGLTADQLYRRKDLPFRVQAGPGTVRFSVKGIERWIRAKTIR
jgi:predicted DNA-binding transcriptional regulator AlpA